MVDFFKNLFGTKVKAIFQPDGETNWYFDHYKKVFIKINLNRSTTCDDILTENNKEISKIFQENKTPINKYSNSFCYTIYDYTNPYTELKLTPDQCPYDYWKSPNMMLCYLPENFNDQSKSLNNNQYSCEYHNLITSNDSTNYKQIKKRQKDNVITSGEIHRYSVKKGRFVRKKAEITFDDFIITNSKKKFMIKLNSIKNFFFELTNNSKEWEKMIKDDNLIEITTNNNKVTIWKCQRLSDYEKWTDAFSFALQKVNDNRWNSDLDNTILTHNLSLSNYYRQQVESFGNFNEMISISDIRKLFYLLYNNRLFTDISEVIISYKTNIALKNYFWGWWNFKQLFAILRVDTFKEEKPEQWTMKEMLTYENINYFLELNGKINDIFDTLKKTNSFPEDLDKCLFNVLTENLFDDIWKNIFQKELYPFYFKLYNNYEFNEEEYYQKINGEDRDIWKKMELLLVHYFMDMYHFEENNFLFFNMENYANTESLMNNISYINCVDSNNDSKNN